LQGHLKFQIRVAGIGRAPPREPYQAVKDLVILVLEALILIVTYFDNCQKSSVFLIHPPPQLCPIVKLLIFYLNVITVKN
jgi:hypothetical protein